MSPSFCWRGVENPGVFSAFSCFEQRGRAGGASRCAVTLGAVMREMLPRSARNRVEQRYAAHAVALRKRGIRPAFRLEPTRFDDGRFVELRAAVRRTANRRPQAHQVDGRGRRRRRKRGAVELRHRADVMPAVAPQPHGRAVARSDVRERRRFDVATSRRFDSVELSYRIACKHGNAIASNPTGFPVVLTRPPIGEGQGEHHVAAGRSGVKRGDAGRCRAIPAASSGTTGRGVGGGRPGGRRRAARRGEAGGVVAAGGLDVGALASRGVGGGRPSGRRRAARRPGRGLARRRRRSTERASSSRSTRGSVGAIGLTSGRWPREASAVVDRAGVVKPLDAGKHRGPSGLDVRALASRGVGGRPGRRRRAARRGEARGLDVQAVASRGVAGRPSGRRRRAARSPGRGHRRAAVVDRAGVVEPRDAGPRPAGSTSALASRGVAGRPSGRRRRAARRGGQARPAVSETVGQGMALG